MAKKRSESPPTTSVTAERAARLHKLLVLLGKGPQTRTMLIRRLKLGVRGFYRDLDLLRSFDISIDFIRRRYVLSDDVAVALERLPFPDPGLTLGEARQLAKGRTRAHKKLKERIAEIEK